ncbi:MAG: hypothetical protein HWN80_04915 [Candidatus Lokiarchaeota archaeon]|nr:hypothetical protein [Candidatus Lokiarchaeota archaeon]
MSSNTSKKRLQDYSFLFEYNLSDFIISFKELFKHIKASDIYSGNENIPFQENDKKFQKLLLSEFIA